MSPHKNRPGIRPFAEFRRSIHSAHHADFRGKPRVKLKNSKSFSQMQTHLLERYRGVEVMHSFADANDVVFDCIPVAQQPSLKFQNRVIAQPPTLPPRPIRPAETAEIPKKTMLPSPLSRDQNDKYGNIMFCPPGTIPLRRTTLEELTRHQSLEHFFKKSPFGSGRPVCQTQAVGDAPPTHRWAHAFQNIQNYGGHSFLNIWNPPIGSNQVFSLSQHWYLGGSGANTQTAEVGWQVFPVFYNATSPVLFIYWTADNYQQTGCYNLERPGFVQTNNAWPLGGALSTISTLGEQQYELEAAYLFAQGNWWLFIGGTDASNAIGYFPGSIYNNGVMATGAAEIDYGGEVVGTTSWPPMGSGAFAADGWQKAAYQRDIFYYPADGSAAMNAALQLSEQWPNCYTATMSNTDPSWGDTVYFGKPGGNNCPPTPPNSV